MLKPKVDKFEARFEVCRFIRYPKGMRRHCFYVFVRTNARFLKENYMMNNRVKRDIDYKALKVNTPH